MTGGSVAPPRRLRFPSAVGSSLVLAVFLAACSSGGGSAVSHINPAQGTAVTSATTGTTVAGLIPTVFDCGGGAYEPATLLVQCGDAATSSLTTVTGIKWTSWDATGAQGSGTVNLSVAGRKVSAPARLSLGAVVETDNGAQFSRLTVAWIGPSPEPGGASTTTFDLAVAPSLGSPASTNGG